MPDDTRADIAGHASVTMTNHYAQRDMASLAALLDRAIPDLYDDIGRHRRSSHRGNRMRIWCRFSVLGLVADLPVAEPLP